jgi:hypothetical protein
MTTATAAVVATLDLAAKLLDDPPCCRAEKMRREADAIWDADPTLADSYELFAVRTLERHALPYDRNHDIDTCERRASALW